MEVIFYIFHEEPYKLYSNIYKTIPVNAVDTNLFLIRICEGPTHSVVQAFPIESTTLLDNLN